MTTNRLLANSKRGIVRCLTWIVLLSAIFPLASLPAQEWRVRRVLVPQASMPEVIAGQGSYLTVDRARFDELIAAGLPRTVEQGSLERFTHATFHGRLDADGTLRGQALLTLGATPGEQDWISVQPPAFWIGSARWLEAEGRWLPGTHSGLWSSAPIASAPQGSNGTTSRGALDEFLPAPELIGRSLIQPLGSRIEFPAIIGSSPDGRWVIERVGFSHLSVDWVIVGERAADAPTSVGPTLPLLGSAANTRLDSSAFLAVTDRVFHLKFPASIASTWFLELPSDLVPSVEGGLARPVWIPPRTAQANVRRWRIDLGPLSKSELTLRSSSSTVASSDVPLSPVWHESICLIEPGLLELRTRVQWSDQQRDVLQWAVDSRWEQLPVVIETSEGERRVVPQIIGTKTIDEESGTVVTECRLTGLVEDQVKSLTLTLQRRYEFNEPLHIQAPLIDARWQRSTLEINRSPRLQLTELALSEGIWSQRATRDAATAPSPLGTWKAEGLGPELAIDLAVEPLISTIEGSALTTVQAEGGKVSAKLQAWLKPVGEPTFQWRTPLSDGWLVDRITASIAGDTTTTEIVDSWDLVAGDDGQTWLEVRFASAWTEPQSMQIIVEAHRPSFPSPLDAISARELRLVQWDQNALVRHWLGLQSENPYRFVSVGERMPKQVLPDIDPRIDAWFFENPTARLLDLEIDGDLQFSLRTELVDQIAVDQEITATMFERSASQRVVLRCRPMGGRPNELNLTWDRAPRGEWEWVLRLPNQNRTLPIQVLDRSDASNVVTTLAWGIGLSEPFVIEGNVIETWDQQWSPSLPRVDGARESTGILTVVSLAREVLDCESDNSARLPASIARVEGDAKLLTVIDLGTLAFPVTVSRRSSSLASPIEPAAEENNSVDERAPLVGSIESLSIETWLGAEATRHRLQIALGSNPPEFLELTAPRGARLMQTNQREPISTRVTNTSNIPSGTSSETKETNSELSSSSASERSVPRWSSEVPVVVPAADGREIWRWSLANHDPGEVIEVMFVTSDQMPRMRGMLNCPMPELSLPVAQTQWKLHVTGSVEVQLPNTEPRSIAAMLVQRWFGFEVKWQPLFESLEPSSAEGVELLPSRTDPIVTIVGAGTQTQLVVRRPEVLRWWCLAAILLQSAVWLTVLRSRVWMAGAIVGTIALWVPASWVDVTWTMVPAAILATLAAIRWPIVSTQPVARRDVPAATQRAAVMTGLVLAVASIDFVLNGALLDLNEAGAQDSASTLPLAPTAVAAQESKVAIVYVPIDEAGNEVRDVILVPRDFYDSLLKQAPQSQPQLPWIVESIRHTIDAEPNPFDDQTRLRLTSRFRIRTLEAAVDWPIPIASESLAIQADQIQTDGSTARLIGAPDGSLRARLLEAGVHDLVVTSIDLLREEDQAVADWKLAPCLDSELRVNGLVDRGLEVKRPNVWLDSDRLGLDRRTLPGPTTQLQVARRGIAAVGTMEAYPLGVLTVLEPVNDRAELKVWLSAGLRQSLPDLLQLRIVGDWELLSTTIPNGLLVDSERTGSELSVELALTQLTPRPNFIGLTLRAPATFAPGRHPLPVVQVPGGNIVARHLVWRQPTTASWSMESSRGTPLTGVDSLATWWPSEQLVAMRVLEGQRQISARSGDAADWLRVAPLETIASVDQQWGVEYSPAEATWNSSTLVSVRRGEVQSLQMACTVPIEIDSLEMVLPDGRKPIDVVRLSSSRLLLILPTPQRTSFTISGSGRFRLRANEAAPIPILSFPEFSDSNYRGQFTRTADLHVRMFEQKPEGLVPVDPAMDLLEETTSAEPTSTDTASMPSAAQTFARRWMNERTVEIRGDAAQISQWQAWNALWNTASYPQLSQSTTRFEREASGWLVSVELTVSESEPWGADCFDVLLPEGFMPLASEGEGAWSTPSGSGPSPIARWTATQRIPPGGSATLRGRVSRFPDGRILPRVLAAREMPRVVELPTAGPNDPFLWKYDRYRPVGATEAVGIRDSQEQPASDQAWLRLLEEEPSASLRLASKPLIARPSRVFLAEHRVTLNEQGVRVWSRFLLDPGGRSRVRLSVPQGLEILQVSIDGERRVFDASGMIDLTSRELPQDLLVECWLPLRPVSDVPASESAFTWPDWMKSLSAAEPQGDSDFSSTATESPAQVSPVDQESAAFDPRNGLALVVPELDVPATRTIVAVRPSQRWGSWQSSSSDAELNPRQWHQTIDAANDEVRRSLATVAGLSPLAMERWLDAWKPSQGETSDVEAISRPALVLDDATGEVIWASPSTSFADDLTNALGSDFGRWKRTESTLPSDSEMWQVWQWKEGTAQIEAVPVSSSWRAKLLTSLGLVFLASVIGMGIRWLPLTLPFWIDLGCFVGGICWVATIEPVGPGVALIAIGLMPLISRGFWSYRRPSQV